MTHSLLGGRHGGNSKQRRIPVVACSVVLLIAALGLYFSYAFCLNTVDPLSVGASNSSFNTSHISTEPDKQDETSNQDSQHRRDAFILHPNDHMFREPRSIHLDWNITKGERAPDGVKKNVYLINGQFPGPTIEARSGDELIVNVHNFIGGDNDGLAIHWHGLSMKGANHMDGVVGLTQCAIGESETFSYRFKIDETQSGTFWYHSHSGVQRADGLYGGLVVHRPATEADAVSDLSEYAYDSEQLLLVGDWYHRQAEGARDWFLDPQNIGIEPAPDSLLINGKGSFNCSMAVKAFPVECEPVEKPKIRFVSGDRVRLRVVNVGASSGVTMAIQGGAMKLITVDGGNRVSPAPAVPVIGVLYPGERMDLIVDRVKSSSGGDTITITLDEENMKVRNYALTRSQAFPLIWDGEPLSNTKMPDRKADATASFRLSEASGPQLGDSLNVDERSLKTTVLYSTMQLRGLANNRPVGMVNHTSWLIADPKAKPLLAMSSADWGNATKQPMRVQKLKVPWYKDSGADKWIDVVFNNVDDTGHPFHLHGYDFYVLAIGKAPHFGGYNPFDPGEAAKATSPNTANPLRKDTIYIPGGGYAILRFPLNNDGLWLLHCHVLWHQAAGMGIVLQIGEVEPETRSRAGVLCTR